MIVTIEIGSGHQVQGVLVRRSYTYATVSVDGQLYTGLEVPKERKDNE